MAPPCGLIHPPVAAHNLRQIPTSTISHQAQPEPVTMQPAPEPVVESTPQSLATSTVSDDEIKAFVLEAVSEKTGYPAEMLDLGLDLEADLGIDTVKQAELFATIRTHYNIPRREDLRLSEYNTLEKVIGFMRDALASGNSAQPAPAISSDAQRAPESVHKRRQNLRQYLLHYLR